jgi:hypothetical protein
MKRLLFAASIFSALVITVGVFTAQAKAEPKKNERATIKSTESLKLLGVFLEGEYLIVHVEDRMAKSKDCTYVYDAKGALRFRVVASRSNLTK